MTTKTQIDRLLGELVRRNPDLAQSGRFVITKPLRHVMRSISIDRGITADSPGAGPNSSMSPTNSFR